MAYEKSQDVLSPNSASFTVEEVQLAYQAPDASKVKVQLWMKGELSARSQRRHS